MGKSERPPGSRTDGENVPVMKEVGSNSVSPGAAMTARAAHVPRVRAPVTADVCALSPVYDADERREKMGRIKRKMKRLDAVLVAHYYTDENIQRLAEETGGLVSDSLEMARFGRRLDASTLIVAGVRFMGETAKILSPGKRVLMPTLEATCSLDLSCPAGEFEKFRAAHPDHVVVVYANTSAEVKALSDWVVTSSIAAEVICHLMDRGKSILWAPDRYLGSYLRKVTGADMTIWQGSCVVHEEFKYHGVLDLKARYPDAAVLAHPESPAAVLDVADAVGSTSALIRAVRELPNRRFIVATDNRIFYKMKQIAPDKEFIEAPTHGEGATCRSCAHCPWMAMNGLHNLEDVLDHPDNEVHVPEEVRERASRATERMIAFAEDRAAARGTVN